MTNDNNALFSAQPAIAANGTLTYTPTLNKNGSAIVTLRLRDSGGTAHGGQDTSAPQTFAITVTPVNDPPTVLLTTTPVSSTAPLTATFTANASDPDGDVLTYAWDFGDNSQASDPISATHRYGHIGIFTATVVVSDGLVSASASQAISVNRRSDGLPDDPITTAPPLDTTVATNICTATKFLYADEHPIQTGVISGTFAACRVAVLRGKVLNRDGTSLPGVTITILDHPEYGQTLSRADGMFDMVVNSGGLLTVNYEKDGYLPA